MNSPIVSQPLPPRYTDEDSRDGIPVPKELRYLNTLNQVKVIQQLDEYEALYLKTLLERRNTYYIGDENEKVFYFAKEVTDSVARLCCNSRQMEVHFRDDYGVTFMILRRPLRCDSSCWWCFCLQEVEIEYPRGIVCAYVRGKWTPWWPALDVVTPEGELLYSIRGSCFSTKFRCHNTLQVYDGKSRRQVASYHKQWAGCSDFCASINDFSVKYEEPVKAEDKLLLLGAGFLADLVYLEHRSF